MNEILSTSQTTPLSIQPVKKERKKPKLNKTKQNKLNKTKQNKTNKTKQNKVKETKTKENKIKKKTLKIPHSLKIHCYQNSIIFRTTMPSMENSLFR